jgi:hydrogenase nickel incorporation protein HypA/HybF
MHEMTVTRHILDTCRERAGNARVRRVTLEIGVLTCIMPDTLKFCYLVAAEGTNLEGSELEIIRTRGRTRCRDCGALVPVADVLSSCGCGSFNLDPPQGGDELRIKSMDIEEAA